MRFRLAGHLPTGTRAFEKASRQGPARRPRSVDAPQPPWHRQRGTRWLTLRAKRLANRAGQIELRSQTSPDEVFFSREVLLKRSVPQLCHCPAGPQAPLERDLPVTRLPVSGNEL